MIRSALPVLISAAQLILFTCSLGLSKTFAQVVSDAKTESIVQVATSRAQTVVRLTYPDNPAIRSGVIISPDGLILTMSNHWARDLKTEVNFADGRKAIGKTLGFSEGLGFGLVQITDPGRWAYAPIHRLPATVSGRPGVVLGYPRRPDRGFDTFPTARLADVSVVSANGWAAVDCLFEFSEFGSALFDLDGKLVGIMAASSGGLPHTFSLASVAEKHLDDLKTETNLDYKRTVSREKLESAKAMPGRTKAEQVRGEITEDVKKRAIEATVKIIASPDKRYSGVLIDEQGIVVTCAHGGLLPGDDVTVVLSSDRKVPAKALGVNRITDVGLIRLQGHGPWPSVKMGDSSEAAEGQPCLIVGYPAPDQGAPERVLDVVAAVRPPLGYNAVLLSTSWDYRFFGGMSGGGVFDREGRLIAVHNGVNRRIEVVKSQWDQLLGETGLPPAQVDAKSIVDDKVANRCSRMAVVIELDHGQVAMGTIVDRGGLVLTKSSVVGDEVKSRLHDGREVAGKVIRRLRGHDLALVKLDGVTDLDAVRWSEPHEYLVGTPVWAPTGKGRRHTGIISTVPRAIGHEPAWTGEGLVESPDGPLFNGNPRSLRDTFQKGDIVSAIDGRETPTIVALKSAAHSVAERIDVGEPVAINLKRAGMETRRVILYPTAPAAMGDLPWPWESARRSGFEAVLTSDLSVSGTDCGGPVLTLDGEFVGISIASMRTVDDGRALKKFDPKKFHATRRYGGVYVVPAAAVREILSQPHRDQGKGSP